VLLALAGIRALVGAPTGPAMRPIAAQVVVVRPGQTLWSIAVAHDPPHTPLLAFLDRLEAETHGRPLQVGQQLVLP
ncbi:LysM peptidoglycan-binding domain-containing protein, partial [Acidimicrobiaceae bacterium USS-CC1]|nr:LysM peptidoglycan-binding domain-containing protein [Acidiferrimicrobium australe]